MPILDWLRERLTSGPAPVITLVAACFLYGAWHLVTTREISRPPGVIAATDPRQEALHGTPPALVKRGYKLTALASFDAQARVISAEHYGYDRMADLVPVDLALGWGRMSDTTVLRGMSISQDHRFYFYGWRGQPPIPLNELISHSANMHMIPANERIAKQLARVRAGNLVHFSGYLVQAEGADGSLWVSSLTRDDIGAGACEIVWVEELDAS